MWDFFGHPFGNLGHGILQPANGMQLVEDVAIASLSTSPRSRKCQFHTWELTKLQAVESFKFAHDSNHSVHRSSPRRALNEVGANAEEGATKSEPHPGQCHIKSPSMIDIKTAQIFVLHKPPCVSTEEEEGCEPSRLTSCLYSSINQHCAARAQQGPLQHILSPVHASESEET